MERERQRRGLHASIAGDAADEAIEALVAQFADPWAFVRELVQNSLDAGATRVDVHMAYADGVLDVVFADDGEGMDRATIEGYLLVKFRSTKDRDLTKIGKFGIGFVALFGIRPFEVVVDTGRDAIWHRLVFDEVRTWSLYEMEEPFEGTTVRLRLRRTPEEAAATCHRIHDALVRWCRYAEGDVCTSAEGIDGGWTARSIRQLFDVEGPVRVHVSGDGYAAVLAPHAADVPPVGFYNRGLTLWEGRDALVPGVSFRLDGRHLEHTLARDGVIRDRHHAAAVANVKIAARDRLGEAFHREAAEAARAGDLSRSRALFDAIGAEVPWRWNRRCPMVPAVGRSPLSLDDQPVGLVGRWLGPTRALLCGLPNDRLAVAVAESGRIVVAGGPADGHVRFLSRMWGQAAVHAYSLWRFSEPVPVGTEVMALLSTIKRRGWASRGWVDLVPGRLLGPVGFDGQFAIRQTRLGLDDISSRGHVVVVDPTHPLFAVLLRLPANRAVPLALRAIDLAVGASRPADELVAALLRT